MQKIIRPGSETLIVTSIERTLIDIVVRPAYAGGVFRVLEIYRAAQQRIAADQLLEILKKLDYVYPYHQAIGFLMQHSGYAKNAYERFHALGLHHDFYLTHAMQQPKYSEEWRLFYPEMLAS